MELQAFLHISLTHSKIKFLKQETCRIKIHFTKELSCAKTIKYMHTGTKMILLTFMICKTKHGLKSEF